jgi:hypothetical protein
MIDRSDIEKILVNDSFKEVVDTLRLRYTNDFINSEDYAADDREIAYRNLRVLNDLVNELESIAKTGEIKAKALKIL